MNMQSPGYVIWIIWCLIWAAFWAGAGTVISMSPWPLLPGAVSISLIWAPKYIGIWSQQHKINREWRKECQDSNSKSTTSIHN